MSWIKGNITIAFGQNSCHENHYVSAKTPINGYHKKGKSPKNRIQNVCFHNIISIYDS